MSIGDTVMHETFGTGVIQDMNGSVAQVRFNSGLVKSINIGELDVLMLS